MTLKRRSGHMMTGAAAGSIAASATSAASRPFAALVARLPHLWVLCVAAVGLTLSAHLLYGANSNVASMVFAAAWSLLGAAAFIAPDDRDVPRLSAPIGAAAICFAGVLVVGALQLLPAAFGSAHPLWANVENGSALTVDRDATTRELIKLVSLAGAFCVGMTIGGSDSRARFFVFVFLSGAAAYSAWAFLQHFVDPGNIFGIEKPYHFDRLTASFLSANTAATLFGLFSIVAAARIARALKESAAPGRSSMSAVEAMARKGGLSAVTLVLALTCMFLTGSRAGAAATSAAIMLFVAWETRAAGGVQARARGFTSLLAVFAVLLAAAAVIMGRETVGRLGVAAGDAAARLSVFETHMQAILAAPLRGHGLGGFPAVNDFLLTAQNHLELERLNALHNVYLQWIEEAGAVGAALMFACIAFLLTTIWRGLHERRRMRTWLRAVLAISALICVHGLVDYALQVPSIAWLWAVWLGVGCGIASPSRRRSPA